LRKRKRLFRGAKIKVDKNLAQIVGKKEGKEILPFELTKGVWTYIKRRKLLKKS